MTEPPKKKVRCTFGQKQRLIELMECHKEVALGIFTCPMGFQKMESIWKNIAAELAKLGPAKSVEQWKTTWRDLKSKTKTKNANINRARKRTGNNENVPVLTTGEEKILGITGKTTSQGLDVPETIIRPLLESSPTHQLPAQQYLPHHSSPPQSPPYRSLPYHSPPHHSSPPQSPPYHSPPYRSPPHHLSPPPTQSTSRTRSSRKRSAKDLGQIYEACSGSSTAALTAIAKHLESRNAIEEKRNLIESERNIILKERNRLLESLLMQSGGANIFLGAEEV